MSGGLAQVAVALVALLAWVAPLIVVRLLADPLDATPYLLAVAAGLAVATLLGASRWPTLRSTLAGGAASPPRGTALVLLVALCPTWIGGLVLGANRAFDRSPPVARDCRVVEWQRPAKGPARCLVTSWRGNGTEKIPAALVLDGAPTPAGAAYPSACAPGQTVVVTTRAGALGWPWIADVRPR